MRGLFSFIHTHCALLLTNGTTKKWSKSNHAAADYSWKKSWSTEYQIAHRCSPTQTPPVNGLLFYDHTLTLTFQIVVSSPLRSALQCSVHCSHTNQLFWVLSDALWLAGRLRVADKVNPVNMARDKAIPKGAVTTKLAHRVQGMEVLFIFCALGSAAIPHVS